MAARLTVVLVMTLASGCYLSHRLDESGPDGRADGGGPLGACADEVEADGLTPTLLLAENGPDLPRRPAGQVDVVAVDDDDDCLHHVYWREYEEVRNRGEVARLVGVVVTGGRVAVSRFVVADLDANPESFVVLSHGDRVVAYWTARVGGPDVAFTVHRRTVSRSGEPLGRPERLAGLVDNTQPLQVFPDGEGEQLLVVMGGRPGRLLPSPAGTEPDFAPVAEGPLGRGVVRAAPLADGRWAVGWGEVPPEAPRSVWTWAARPGADALGARQQLVAREGWVTPAPFGRGVIADEPGWLVAYSDSIERHSGGAPSVQGRVVRIGEEGEVTRWPGRVASWPVLARGRDAVWALAESGRDRLTLTRLDPRTGEAMRVEAVARPEDEVVDHYALTADRAVAVAWSSWDRGPLRFRYMPADPR